MFNEKQLKDFQNIYEEELGEIITKTEAIEQGTEIINLIEIIFSPCGHKNENILRNNGDHKDGTKTNDT